jgi:hypothetical protein
VARLRAPAGRGREAAVARLGRAFAVRPEPVDAPPLIRQE